MEKEQARVNAAILKTAIKSIAETRALRDLLLMHMNPPIEGLKIALNHYKNAAEREEKALYEEIYGEFASIPSEITDLL